MWKSLVLGLEKRVGEGEVRCHTRAQFPLQPVVLVKQNLLEAVSSKNDCDKKLQPTVCSSVEPEVKP